MRELMSAAALVVLECALARTPGGALVRVTPSLALDALSRGAIPLEPRWVEEDAWSVARSACSRTWGNFEYVARAVCDLRWAGNCASGDARILASLLEDVVREGFGPTCLEEADCCPGKTAWCCGSCARGRAAASRWDA